MAAARITVDRRGYWLALEPSLARAELADRALRIRSPTRTHADVSECRLRILMQRSASLFVICKYSERYIAEHWYPLSAQALPNLDHAGRDVPWRFSEARIAGSEWRRGAGATSRLSIGGPAGRGSDRLVGAWRCLGHLEPVSSSTGPGSPPGRRAELGAPRLCDAPSGGRTTGLLVGDQLTSCWPPPRRTAGRRCR